MVLGWSRPRPRSAGSSSGTGSASKKTLHAAEQERPDVAEARQMWKAEQPGLDASKLVFIDETGTNTKMVRQRGRCAKGRRLMGKAPWGHWKTTTFVAGLRCNEISAPCVLDGPMDGQGFLVYVERVLVPSLSDGDIALCHFRYGGEPLSGNTSSH